MAEVEGLTHSGICAINLPATEAFYENVFGARFANHNGFDTNHVPKGRSLHSVLTIGDYLLATMLPFNTIPMPPPERKRGINPFRHAFAVSKARFDEVVGTLRERGVAFEGPIAHPERGPFGESIYFQDPGGNFLEVCWRRDEHVEYHPTRVGIKLSGG